MAASNEIKLPDDAAVAGEDAFWAKIYRDATWSDAYNLNLNPVSAIDQQRLIFEVTQMQGDNYIFLNKMKILYSCKLLDKDGNAPAKPSNVAPINGFGATIFNSCKLYLNDTQIASGGNGLYAFWANTHYCLDSSTEQRYAGLQAAGFYPESGKDCWLQPTFDNEGWDDRKRLFGKYVDPTDKESFEYNKMKEATVISEVLTDFTGTTLPMVPRVAVRVELTLNHPGFYLQTTNDGMEVAAKQKYYLHITKANLIVPVKTMAPGLSADMERKLQKMNLDYRTHRRDLKKILIPAGVQTFTTDNIKQSMVSPDRLVIFIANAWQVDQEYGYSALQSSPFVSSAEDQEHREAVGVALTSVRLSLNNQSLEMSPSAKTAEELHSVHYVQMQENLGMYDYRGCLDISKDQFVDGYYYVLYDLTKSKRSPVGVDNFVRQDTKPGALKLDLSFEKPLPEAAYLFVYSHFHSKVTVDKNRNVTYKYLD